MELYFKIQGDRLIAGSVLCGNSGNAGTYKCNFDIADNKDFLWFCVFKKEDTAYQQVIENGKCVVPKEVMEEQGKIQIGCYGTYGDMRMSTNWIIFSVEDGAYSEATAPDEPTPDVWETLVMNSVPYIGESGNWYVYDMEKKEYTDSGVSARKECTDSAANAIKETVSGTELVLKNISPFADSIKIKTSDDASVYVVSETIDGTEWEFSTAAASVVSSYIPVQPNEEYFLHCSVGAFSFEEYGINLFNIITYYDSDMQAVSTESVARNGVATIPDGCYYMVIRLYDSYGTTYNNDIYISAYTDTIYTPVDGVVTVSNYNPEYVYIKSCTGVNIECEYSKDTKAEIDRINTQLYGLEELLGGI